MYYSVVEQHIDGSWWYHRRTFETKEEALEYAQGALDWRDSRQIVFEHSNKLPDETLWTRDFEEFLWVGSYDLVAGKSGFVQQVADIVKKAKEPEKIQPADPNPGLVIWVAQTSKGVFSVVNENYPGAVRYLRSEND